MPAPISSTAGTTTSSSVRSRRRLGVAGTTSASMVAGRCFGASGGFSTAVVFGLSAMGTDLRRRVALGQVGADMAQHVQKGGLVFGRQAGQRLGAGLETQRLHASQDRLGLFGQMEKPHTAVVTAQSPLDPARLFQAVNETAERDVLDFEDVGEAALVDALVARKIGQDLPLG